MIILGVDPGSRFTGYGLIDCATARPRLVVSGRISLPAAAALAERLVVLAGEIESLLGRERPALVAIEKPFHGVNARSAQVLAETRGALLLTFARAGIAIVEFAPAEVKIAVTGSGRADKEQVAGWVRRELGLAGRAMAPDESDALALALCAALRRPFATRIAAALAR